MYEVLFLNTNFIIYKIDWGFPSIFKIPAILKILNWKNDK